jgi:hypothetical protein
VVVTLVIDQLAAWVAAERLPELPPDGGFARLRREGTWVRDMRYAHADTETAPGHAALYTGLPPHDNGIYTNDVPAPGDEHVALVQDPATRLVDARGPTERPGASAARLRAPALADRLRERVPGATIVGLSLKDRGSVLGAGHHPDAAIWYDHKNDALVTSTAFADALPAWALPFATPAALAARRAVAWTPLDGAFLAAHARTPDEGPGEGDYLGLGTAFPHDFARAGKPATAFRVSPQADVMLLEMGLAAVDARRDRGQPMLLALSLSSHDYVVHTFGIDSWEEWDELLRLDRALATFFAGLDARVGPGGWSLLLAGDHGGSSMPEVPAAARPWCVAAGGDGRAAGDRWERPCAGGGRLDSEVLLPAAQAAAVAALGKGDWLRGEEDSFLFLGEAAQALPSERRAALDAAVIARLGREPGVAAVVDLDALPPTCPEGDSLEALVCRTTRLDDGAGYFVVPAPGWAFVTSLVPGRGGNHGTPYLHDRSVPLLVRAPGRVPAGVVLDEPISFASFARTAASLLGIGDFAPAGRDLAARQ